MISSTVCSHPPPPRSLLSWAEICLFVPKSEGGNTIPKQSTVHCPLPELKEWYLAITEKPTQQKKEKTSSKESQ